MKRVRVRDFSPQAWAYLLHWEEIDSSVVGQPICSSCYSDLRELLIDRSSEMEQGPEPSIASQQAIAAEMLHNGLPQDPIAS